MRKHPFDVTAFIWGLLFLTGAAALLLDEYVHVSFDPKWLLPAALVTLAIGGIASSLRQMGK
ncbi:MAG: hypothetical protein ACYC3W_00540 [Candidatus Nanopelagicales bacterium]